jgi:hypothetical protein
MLKYIKALAKNHTDLNHTSIEQLCEINVKLAEYYNKNKHLKTIQKKFDILLNFLNRSIYNIFIHEVSRRPDYNSKTHPYVLSKQHILYSTKIGIKLIAKGHLRLGDMFAQDAKYNLVTGKNLQANDPNLKKKFFELWYLYAKEVLKNTHAVPSPNYIRSRIFDGFSGPCDSPKRDYNQRVISPPHEPRITQPGSSKKKLCF